MVNKLLKVKPRLAYRKYEFGRLPLIISPSRTQKRFAPWRLKFFVNFVWKRAEVYPRGGVRTVNVANPTNGYAAEKGISKVVSDDNGNLRDNLAITKKFCKHCDR